MDVNQKPSWDRQPNESAKAYTAFCTYRDYGIDRSVTKVLERYNGNYGSRSMLTRWSNRYGWVKRCFDFDIFMEKERRKELHSYHLAMIKRHADQAQLLQEKAIAALQGIDPTSFSNQELLRYIEVGMKLERDTLACASEEIGFLAEDDEKDQIDPIATRVYDGFIETAERLLAMRAPTK